LGGKGQVLPRAGALKVVEVEVEVEVEAHGGVGEWRDNETAVTHGYLYCACGIPGVEWEKNSRHTTRQVPDGPFILNTLSGFCVQVRRKLIVAKIKPLTLLGVDGYGGTRRWAPSSHRQEVNKRPKRWR
jgi:hypothetical protein